MKKVQGRGKRFRHTLCAERTAATFCRSRSAVRSAVAAHCIIYVRI
jgi:hypothetical protein